MAKQAKDFHKIDFSKIGKSKRLKERNKDYLDLLSIVEKSKYGLAIEQANLRSKPARESAKQLLGQLDLILHMVTLPHVILMVMEGHAHGYEMALKIVLGGERSGEDKRKVFEKHFERTMQHFFALDVSGSLSRPWLFAITLYIWTAFECLASDLWAASLNQAPNLGQRILASLPNDDAEKSGLSRRHIDVGLAARYGFDLRRSLGTVLRSKFDFSSLAGIEAAYEQGFGASGNLEDEHHTLAELEQVRHLIMHRGGVADEKFVKITKLKIRPGETLSLKLPQVGGYMMSVTLGCVALLKVVDKWLLDQK